MEHRIFGLRFLPFLTIVFPPQKNSRSWHSGLMEKKSGKSILALYELTLYYDFMNEFAYGFV